MTCKAMVCPAVVLPATSTPRTTSPGRVSRKRSGVTGTNGTLAGNQPLTSAMTCVGFCVKMHTLPPSPILAITRFGAVMPAVAFRFEAFGRSEPHGHTVT